MIRQNENNDKRNSLTACINSNFVQTTRVYFQFTPCESYFLSL